MPNAHHMAPAGRGAQGRTRGKRLPWAMLAVLIVLAVGGVAFLVTRMVQTADRQKEAQQAEATQQTTQQAGEGQPAEGTASESSTEPAADSGAEPNGETQSKSEPATPVAAAFGQRSIKSVRLVGDSITAGFGTDGYVDANLTGEGAVIYDDGAGKVRYETPAQTDCWANAFRSYATAHGVQSFVNAGINGAFMTELADNPGAWIADGADLIVVALGTNDCGYVDAQTFRQASETALAAADEDSDMLVVVSPVHDLRTNEWLVETPETLGNVLREVCDEHGYLFVDAYDAVAPEDFCPDGLHPATSGSLCIWERIRTTLGLPE